MYATIVTTNKSGYRPTMVKHDTLEAAYEQFEHLARSINPKGKIPSLGEVKGGFEVSKFYGFQTKATAGIVMIFELD